MDLPQILPRKITAALEREHYLIAAYDSQEQWNQHIVVVTDDVLTPTLVVRRRTRKAPRRSNILALAVPTLAELTLELAQTMTRVGTDYVTVREWAQIDRRHGIKHAGVLVGQFPRGFTPSPTAHHATVTLDDGAQVELTTCPQDGSCAVWRECEIPGCQAPEEPWFVDEDEAFQHGVEHQWIDGSWMTRDEPYNCAARWIEDWEPLILMAQEHGNGTYVFDVEYDNDAWSPLNVRALRHTSRML